MKVCVLGAGIVGLALWGWPVRMNSIAKARG